MNIVFPSWIVACATPSSRLSLLLCVCVAYVPIVITSSAIFEPRVHVVPSCRPYVSDCKERSEEATRQNQLNCNECRCATAVVHKQPQHNLCCCCCCWTFRRQKRRRSVQAPKLSTTTITTTANAPGVMTNDTLRLCTQGLGPPMATADDTAFHNDDDDDEEPNDVPRDPPKVPPPLTINNNVTTSLGAHHHHHLPNPNHHLDHHQPKQSHHHHNPHHTTTTTTTNQTQPHQQADEQYSPSCHESLNHSSTGSERESDSACCACDAASCSGSTSSECAAHDAPPPPTSAGIISDACDWWFLRNRGSHKSNSRYTANRPNPTHLNNIQLPLMVVFFQQQRYMRVEFYLFLSYILIMVYFISGLQLKFVWRETHKICLCFYICIQQMNGVVSSAVVSRILHLTHMNMKYIWILIFGRPISSFTAALNNQSFTTI